MTGTHTNTNRDPEHRLLRAQQVGKFGSWEVDLAQNTLSWSDSVFAIFEIARADFGGTEEAFFALIHPDDRPGFLAARADWLARGGPFLFEHRIVTPGGQVKWVVERAEIILDDAGAPAFTTGTVQDVTDLKQAERARDRAERDAARQTRLLKLAGKIGKIGGWHYDASAERVEWSDETAAIHDETPGKNPTPEAAIAYYVPEHRDRIRAQFESCVQRGQPYDDMLQIVTAAGRRKWIHTLGEAVRDAEGRIVAVEGAIQDIDDLIAARDETARISARLRRTLDSLRDGFFLLDADWKFAFLNDEASRLLGRSRGELLGKVIWEVFPKAVGTAFQTECERAVAEARGNRFRTYCAPLDGWFQVSADPTPEGLSIYLHDVTRERARDMQLRLLEAAVAKQNDILLITDAEPIDGPDGPRIVYVNDAFERRTGYTRDEVIGKTPRFLQGPDTQRDELDRIRSALEQWQPVRSELINYTKSGTPFWIELDIVPLADDDGGFTHWVAIERDITARKQTEQALRDNEERLRLVAKAAGNTIWDLDVVGQREWWNENLRDNFGHDPAIDADSPPSIWRDNVHPDDLPHSDAAFDRLLSGQDTVLHNQYRFRRADGTYAIVQDSAFALPDDTGRVVRVLGSMTDITERRQLEDRLQQAQKMEAVGQLTGGVAHDFNNLLTIMLGNAEVLQEALRDDPVMQDLAGMVVTAAERGADLTRRLMAFSRKQPLEPRVLDVAQVIGGMDGMLRRTLPETIAIEIVRSGGLWPIEADAAQLESAILNTALNARDAMPDGGWLTVEMANTTLDERHVAGEPDVAPGDYVVITVSDSGHGMPPDVRARVFEPFFTTKETGKGSGLGLSMVFGFVKQSGGHIRVYSEVDEGTSFKMYFPRVRGKQAPAVPERARPGTVGGSETVLVVEDDDAVRDHVTMLLDGLGYRVLEAATGAVAMDLLERKPDIDLLFTDVVMPGGMAGPELAVAARALRPDLRILFTSGYTENAVMHHGRLAHGVKLLSKPYRRQQLAAKLREALESTPPDG